MEKSNKPPVVHLPPHDREEANTILLGIQNMIYKRVRDIASTYQDDDVEEIAQKCMIHLWTKSMPKYVPDRRPHVKMSTFLHECATNFILQEVRSRKRAETTSRAIRIAQQSDDTQPAHDSAVDQVIDTAAIRIVESPEKYFTVSQRRVFNIMVENAHLPKKDIARILGYKRASSLSTMLLRIRNRIKEIDVESLGLGGDGIAS